MDTHSVQELTGNLQTIVAMFSSIGIVEGLKYCIKCFQDRKAAILKAEKESAEADYALAREARKDSISEYQVLLAQRDKDLCKKDADFEAYRQETHQRLGDAHTKIAGYHAEKVETMTTLARIEERLKVCEEDRADLRAMIERIDNRVNQVEKHDKPGN